MATLAANFQSCPCGALCECFGIDHGIVGGSAQTRQLLYLIARVAPTPATVLILGDSGTGKELVAQAIHRNSTRSKGPFVAINCAALSEHLLESEMFGHLRGAFTGALCDRKGRIQCAQGGSLFLDEIGELPLALQAKLLRVLEERVFEPVGGSKPIHADIRLIAATNADLRARIASGEFREDLYFRLNVVPITLAPLREREADIPALAAHFIELYCRNNGIPPARISLDALRVLRSYSWPGNVRELRNSVERAVVLSSSPVIEAEDLPDDLRCSPRSSSPNASFRSVVREHKREVVLAALASAGGNVAEAARMLEVNPTYLHRIIRNLGLKPAIRKLSCASRSMGDERFQ